MSENIRKRKDPDFRAFVRRMILIGVSAVAVLILAVFNAVCPFRTLLPAERIAARGIGELRVHFLSVGQGDCALVEFPDGACVLIDAGNGSFENNDRIYRYLKGVEMTSLQIVSTHADRDHFGGIEYLLENTAVEKLWLPAIAGTGERYRAMLDAAQTVACEQLNRYDVIAEHGGAYLVCVSPYSEGETDDNDSSAVLWLHSDTCSVLFAADISSVRERRLMREYALDREIFACGTLQVHLDETDVLKVAHHGSASSCSEEWLNFLGAEVAVLSCGADNVYGHPQAQAVDRLARTVGELYRTDELGDIVISITDRGYAVETNMRSDA